MTRATSGHHQRHGTALLVTLVLTLVTSSPCAAQRPFPPPSPMRIRPAVRLDAVLDRDPGAQVALGAAIAGAYNVRIGLDAGIGGVQRSGGWMTAGRLDLLARFLSDPFRQSRWGLAAGAGVGQRVEAHRRPTTVAVVTLGLEGPSDGLWVPGVEIGLGGGVRAGLTLRRAPLRQR